MRRVLLLFASLASFQALFGQTATVSGLVRERETGEIIPYVTFVDSLNQKLLSLSNPYGFFSFSVDANKASTIIVRHLGYKSVVLKLLPLSDSTVNIELVALIHQLEEIEIGPDPEVMDPGNSYTVSNTVINQAPALLGEKDVMKAMQLLPGVQRGVEGSTAFYARGGGADQNLIISDDATIYNANHLFGFMSVFNADAIKNVKFYNGSFPARYGGRVSSVTDIQTKDGNKQRPNIVGGLGILSARLTLDGPIVTNKSSYLFSARRSFIDLLSKPFMPKENKESYRLFDVNAKVNFILNEHNALFISGYIGGDKLLTKEYRDREQYSIRAKTALGWINQNISMRWNHMFSEKIFNNISLIGSHYNFYIEDTYQREGLNSNSIYTELNSGIDDYSVKQDLDYYFSNNHTFKIGTLLRRHEFSPRIFYTRDEILADEKSVRQKYNASEFSGYFEDAWKISEKVSLDIGLRYSYYRIKEKQYSRIEPRAHIYYTLKSGLKVDAGYTRTNQFMHLLSNTGVGLPTDLWVPATTTAPPQQGDHLSAGIYKSFVDGKYGVSIETYRRCLKNIISYSQDAEFLDAEETSKEIQWEENITSGKGESYGTELFVEKKNGKVTGWLSYTIAWAIHQFDEINNGKPFFPKYDSRHNMVIYFNFKFSEKINFSSSWMYSTGNAFTIPQAYYHGNFATGTETRTAIMPTKVAYPLIEEDIATVPYFGSKNSYRAEPYHRLDISIQFHKKKKKYHRYWEFGLFNAYNRKNPFYYYLEASNDYVNKGQRIDLKKKSLFPIIPSITYNFKF